MIDNMKITSNSQEKPLINEGFPVYGSSRGQNNEQNNCELNIEEHKNKESICDLPVREGNLMKSNNGEITQFHSSMYNTKGFLNPNHQENNGIFNYLPPNFDFDFNVNKKSEELKELNCPKPILLNQGNIQNVFISNNSNNSNNSKISSNSNDAHNAQSYLRNNETNQSSLFFINNNNINNNNEAGIPTNADPDTVLKKYEQMGLPFQQIFYNMNLISEYHSNRSEFIKAVKFYEKLISLNPENGDAYVALGHCYTILGENEKALDSYKSGLNFLKDVKDSQLWFGIAECSEKLKKIEQSLISCEFILTFTHSKSDMARVYLKLAKYLFTYSYFDIALEYLNKTLLLKDLLSIHMLLETYLLFGSLYLAKKDYINANLYFKKALNIDNNNIKIKLQIAWVCFLQGNYNECNTYIEKAIQLNKNFGDIYFIQSRILLSQNQEKEALNKIKNALSINPGNPLYSCSLGIIHTIIRDFREAYTDFFNCCHSKEYRFDGLFNIGLLYEICNQPSEAIFAYENALKEISENETCKLRLDIIKNRINTSKNASKAEDLIKLMKQPNYHSLEEIIPKPNSYVNNELKDIISKTLQANKTFPKEVVVKYLISYFKIHESPFSNNLIKNLELFSNEESKSVEIPLPHNMINQNIEGQNQIYERLLLNKRDCERNFMNMNYSQNQMLPILELLNRIETNNKINYQVPIPITLNSNHNYNSNLNNEQNSNFNLNFNCNRNENSIQNNAMNNYSNPPFPLNQFNKLNEFNQFNPLNQLNQLNQFNPSNQLNQSNQSNQSNQFNSKFDYSSLSNSNIAQLNNQNSNCRYNYKVPSLSNFPFHPLIHKSEINQEKKLSSFPQIYTSQNNIMGKEIINNQAPEPIILKPEPSIKWGNGNRKNEIIFPENRVLNSDDFKIKSKNQNQNQNQNKNNLNLYKNPLFQESKPSDFYTPVKAILSTSQITPEEKGFVPGKFQKQRLLELSRIADNFHLDNSIEKKSTIVKIPLNPLNSQLKQDLIVNKTDNLNDQTKIIKGNGKRHRGKIPLNTFQKKKSKKLN